MNFILHTWPYVSNHAYLLLFLGMLFGGETVLLPAIYLAAEGALVFPLVFLFAGIATLISDSAWYAIGYNFPLEKILSWKMFLKNREGALKILEGFRTHSQKLLYISKFVYGTRTIAQVLSGSIRMPFFRYSVVNLSGIMSYMAMLSFVALFTKKILVNFDKMPYNTYASVAVFVFLIVILHICLKKWLGKKITASSSQPGTKEERYEK